MFKGVSKIKENQTGNLLFNFLVSFSIMALLAVISIPYLRKYQPNLKLSATARDLTTDLRYAQQLTVTEQVVHTVTFDIINDIYQILKLDTATTTIKEVSLDSDINFQQLTGLTDNKVFFNFYGGVSESGQIILVNTNAKTVTINIKPSGYVQLSQ